MYYRKKGITGGCARALRWWGLDERRGRSPAASLLCSIELYPRGKPQRAQQFGLPALWGGLSRGISRKGQAITANLGGQHPLEPRQSSWNE